MKHREKTASSCQTIDAQTTGTYAHVDMQPISKALSSTFEFVKKHKDHAAVIALTVLFFMLTLTRVGDVPDQYFDEPVYIAGGNALAQLLLPPPQGQTPHPPLGKIILGIGILLFGGNPLGWRVMEALFTALMIPLLYLFGRKLFGNALGGLLAAILISLDFMHFMLAKLAILDTYLAFFALLMQFAFYVYYKYASEHAYAHSTSRLMMASVTFGLATASKWPAVFSFLGFAIVFLYLTWRRYQQNLSTRSSWLRTILWPAVAGGIGLVLAGVTYLASFLPYFVNGWSLGLVLWWNQDALLFHSLPLTYPYSSPWWSWPLMTRPLPIYFYTSFAGVSEILLMGNPAIWWATYPILAASILRAVTKRDKMISYLMVMFLSSWLPFAILRRFEIIYYFYVSLPILILMITYWCLLAWRRPYGKIMVAGYLTVALILFLQFYPILTAIPVPPDQIRNLEWLPGWRFGS